MSVREPVLGRRLAAALTVAFDGDVRPLFDAWGHASGVPGPRANMTLATTVANEIAEAGARGRRAIRALVQSGDEYATAVAAVTFGELAARAKRPGEDLADLGVIAADDRAAVSLGVVTAVANLLSRRGAEGASWIAAWITDLDRGSCALRALADRDVLAAVREGARVVEILDRTWDLMGGSSRAADRSPGLRRLRRELPDHLAILAGRFPAACDWLLAAASVDKPEDREVVERTLALLRRAGVAEQEVARIEGAFTASAPVPRDPTRIRERTRRRGRRR